MSQLNNIGGSHASVSLLHLNYSSAAFDDGTGNEADTSFPGNPTGLPDGFYAVGTFLPNDQAAFAERNGAPHMKAAQCAPAEPPDQTAMIRPSDLGLLAPENGMQFIPADVPPFGNPPVSNPTVAVTPLQAVVPSLTSLLNTEAAVLFQLKSLFAGLHSATSDPHAQPGASLGFSSSSVHDLAVPSITALWPSNT